MIFDDNQPLRDIGIPNGEGNCEVTSKQPGESLPLDLM